MSYYNPRWLQPYELVDEVTYNRYKTRNRIIYGFFDPALLKFADMMRVHFNRPIECNNWKWGGHNDSRGLRQSTNDLTSSNPYSPHCRGQALDLNVAGVSIVDIHTWIKKDWELIKQKTGLTCLYVERNYKGTLISWLHIHTGNYRDGLYFFDV